MRYENKIEKNFRVQSSLDLRLNNDYKKFFQYYFNRILNSLAIYNKNDIFILKIDLIHSIYFGEYDECQQNSYHLFDAFRVYTYTTYNALFLCSIDVKNK